MSENLSIPDLKDPRDAIKEYLEKRGHRYSWLAENLDISRTHMSQILSKKRTLQEIHRQKINEVLNTNF